MNATTGGAGLLYSAGMQNLPPDRAAVVETLEAAIKEWGGSVSSLGRSAGVSPSTITRFLKNPATVPVPKQVTIDKIVGAVFGGPPAERDASHPLRSDIYSIEIAGEVRSGVWVETPDDLEYGPPVVVSLPSIQVRGALSAYRCSSADATGGRWPAGTLLIVDSGLILRQGAEAVFQRVKGDLIETTYRVFRSENGRAWTSTPPRVQGGDWVDATWRDPFSSSQETDGASEIFTGSVIAAVWVGPT